MDNTEQLAAEYLRSSGFTDIKSEPDGNIPPDLLVDGRIAVEVRRLNQNVVKPDGTTEGLEEKFIPMWQRMMRYLPTLGSSVSGESWYVAFDMSRPLQSWRILEPMLRIELLAFKRSLVRTPRTINVTERFKVHIFRAGRPYNTFFRLGGGSDDESGGWVIGEVHRNLILCIEEKERKVAPYRDRYAEWWLVLPDHIGYALDNSDQLQFRTLPTIAHTFAKVILVNPHDPAHAFEI